MAYRAYHTIGEIACRKDALHEVIVMSRAARPVLFSAHESFDVITLCWTLFITLP